MVLLTLMAYNSTTVPPRPKVTKTLIGSHTLQVKCNHQSAALMNGSAWNHLRHLLTSALNISETVQPMCAVSLEYSLKIARCKLISVICMVLWRMEVSIIVFEPFDLGPQQFNGCYPHLDLLISIFHIQVKTRSASDHINYQIPTILWVLQFSSSWSCSFH